VLAFGPRGVGPRSVGELQPPGVGRVRCRAVGLDPADWQLTGGASGQRGDEDYPIETPSPSSGNTPVESLPSSSSARAARRLRNC